MTESLRALLARHQPADAKEVEDLEVMRSFAVSLERPFDRDQWPAHFTGSAAVVDAAGARVCLVLHGKLKRWLQPGGHAEAADGGSMAATALREAREETGLEVTLVSSEVLDVDVHLIPARRDEPEHRHLDVRFAARLASAGAKLRHDPNESDGARWLEWDEALRVADEPALRRLLEKARAAVR